ncbi:hypothetical protein ACFYPZ_20045 [Streptomyces sp. NPDC005506]
MRKWPAPPDLTPLQVLPGLGVEIEDTDVQSPGTDGLGITR